MRKHIFSLLLTGTILSGATAVWADIAISPSLDSSEYTETYTKHILDEEDGAVHEVPASGFADADTIYLNVKSGATGEEHDGDNIIHVDQNTEGNSAFSVIFENRGTLQTTSLPTADSDGGGHIFYMDTRPTNYVDLSGTKVRNYGIMTTDGTGYAVYANPLENQNMTTVVSNTYLLDRVNLYRTDSSQVANGQGIGWFWDDDLQKLVEKKYFVEGAVMNGSVLLGPYAYLYNYGTMQNKTNDFNKDFINTDFVGNSI